jgi:hypothetical protein
MELKQVWIFVGEGGALPSAVFHTRADAEQWIERESVSGILTCYPVGCAVYDWAIAAGFYKPNPSAKSHKSPRQVASFSSAYLEHYHYENGVVQK